jgi:hypothetical protein
VTLLLPLSSSSTFVQEKLNDRFEFPRVMNFEPYTKEGLAWREARDKQAEGGGEGNDGGVEEGGERGGAGDDDGETGGGGGDGDGGGGGEGGVAAVPLGPYQVHPESYYTYNLCGIVVHAGTADYGHYYSFIKSRGSVDAEDGGEAEGWHRFDDDTVTPWDIDERLEVDTFGGVEESITFNASNEPCTSSTPRIRNAYILFYERSRKVPESSHARGHDGADGTRSGSGPLGGMVTPPRGHGTGTAPPQPEGATGGTPKRPGDRPEEGDAGGSPGREGGLAGLEVGEGAVVSLPGQADVTERGGVHGHGEELRNSSWNTLSRASGFIAKLKALVKRKNGDRGDRAVPPKIFPLIWADNNRFLFDRLVFHGDFFAFVVNLYDTLNVTPDLDYESDGGKGALYIRWASRFYITMLLHACENTMLPAMTAALQRLFAENVPAARFFLEHCADNIETVTVPILHCTDKKVRRHFARLVVHIMGIVAPYERNIWGEEEAVIDEQAAAGVGGGGDGLGGVEGKEAQQPKVRQVQRSKVLRFMISFVSVPSMQDAARHWHRFEEYWWVLLEFGKQGPLQRCFLATNCMIAYTLEFMMGDKSPAYETSQLTFPKMGNEVLTPNFGALLELIAILVTASITRTCNPYVREQQLLQYHTWQQDPVRKEEALDAEARGVLPPPPPVKPLPAGRPPTAPTEVWDDDSYGDNFVPHVIKHGDMQHLDSMNLYELGLATDQNRTAMAQIAVHWSWENNAFSTSLINKLVKWVDQASAEEVKYYLPIVTHLLALEDTLQEGRVSSFLGDKDDTGLLGRIYVYGPEKKSHTRWAIACIHLVFLIAESNPAVARHLATSLAPFHAMDLHGTDWCERFVQGLIEDKDVRDGCDIHSLKKCLALIIDFQRKALGESTHDRRMRAACVDIPVGSPGVYSREETLHKVIRHETGSQVVVKMKKIDKNDAAKTRIAVWEAYNFRADHISYEFGVAFNGGPFPIPTIFKVLKPGACFRVSVPDDQLPAAWEDAGSNYRWKWLAIQDPQDPEPAHPHPLNVNNALGLSDDDDDDAMGHPPPAPGVSADEFNPGEDDDNSLNLNPSLADDAAVGPLGPVGGDDLDAVDDAPSEENIEGIMVRRGGGVCVCECGCE